MKYLLIFSIILLACQEAKQECSIGCAGCTNGFCTEPCFGRKKEDGRFCDRKTAPETENCILYEISECSLCNPGFANTPNSFQCEKYSPEIKNCLGARKTQKGDIECFLCDGGFPSTTGDECIQFRGQGPSKNCRWGLKLNGNNECGRCKDGWVNQGGGCVKQVVPGCLKVNIFKTECVSCDVHDGWYMTHFEGKCTKYGVVA